MWYLHYVQFSGHSNLSNTHYLDFLWTENIGQKKFGVKIKNFSNRCTFIGSFEYSLSAAFANSSHEVMYVILSQYFFERRNVFTGSFYQKMGSGANKKWMT